jgi:hypothetical protein
LDVSGNGRKILGDIDASVGDACTSRRWGILATVFGDGAGEITRVGSRGSVAVGAGRCVSSTDSAADRSDSGLELSDGKGNEAESHRGDSGEPHLAVCKLVPNH